MESQVYMEDIKDDQSAAADVEPVELGTGGQGALMANGHLCSDMKADSFEASTEPESHADESKPEQNVTDVAELVEQDAASEEQDGTDALENNGHIQVAMSADSCLVATESMVHANEMKGKESVQQEEEAPTTEVKVLEGGVQAVGRNCAGSVEEPIEEEVDAHGDSYVGGRADASRVPEAVIEEVEGEATCGILQMEEKMDKGGEESLCNDCTAGIACSNEEVEHPLEEGINVAAPDVGELEEVTENRSGEIVQGDESVKDEVSICILHSLKPESDTCVESTREHKGQLQVSTGVETASDSILKADNVVEVNTAAPLLSQQICDSAESVGHEQLEPLSIGQASEIENDVAEAEPNKVVGVEVVNAVSLEADDVAEAEPNKDVEMEAVDAVPLETADVAEAEPMKEVETGVVGAAPLQAAAASAACTFHNEPRRTDLVDSDSIRHSSPPATKSESCDHIHTTNSRPREISDTAVDQLLSSASLGDETTVADESKLTSEAGDGSQEKNK
uniref:Uncharacterized protein n=1 Tax=Arundo donax TaxID=35708 RepID=A0A0A9CIE7_ARUDO